MNFWKKNLNDEKIRFLNSDEYERISKRITELDSNFTSLKNKFEILQTSLDNLRGNFNRKLSGIKKEEEQEESKDINTEGYKYFG
jgi:predicted  nucleic acid-binding Zn-ribbon protein